MSRTYRCRHLPVLPGTPRKLVDSRLYKRLGHIDREELRLQSGDTTRAVGYLLEHPWVAMEAGYSKRLLRIDGNRRVRRSARAKVRRWEDEGDDFEEFLPDRLEGWDYWKVI